jgi:hypothetical protein
MNVRDIVDRFGGQTALANALGKGQSTVAYWVKSGSIPVKWHGALVEAANRKGIPILPQDFAPASAASDTVVFTDSASALVVEPVPDRRSDLEERPFLFYASPDGTVRVRVLVEDETVWASQRGMSEIFGVEVPTINYHLKEIFASAELDEQSVLRKFLTTASDGKSYETGFYSLDAIISVGYRVNSLQATQFRRWATGVLKEYLIKGYSLDDERLKNGKTLFGKDYFDELLERIREIRASERRFYQKITDIYSQCSIDYDKNSPITKNFYAHVQDKLHYAIHGQTSAELIDTRADARKPNMGLQYWENQRRGGKITKRDVPVGKNYLTESELKDLNRLVSMYLDSAENFAIRRKTMTMQQWADMLDRFLEFNAYEVLPDFGKVRREVAERHAISEYEKFRVVQDREYRSDFDRVVDAVKTRRLPSPSAPLPPSSRSQTDASG